MHQILDFVMWIYIPVANMVQRLSFFLRRGELVEPVHVIAGFERDSAQAMKTRIKSGMLISKLVINRDQHKPWK